MEEELARPPPRYDRSRRRSRSWVNQVRGQKLWTENAYAAPTSPSTENDIVANSRFDGSRRRAKGKADASPVIGSARVMDGNSWEKSVWRGLGVKDKSSAKPPTWRSTRSRRRNFGRYGVVGFT